MSHEGYHEPVDRLTAATMDFHRAVVSLIEELEAVDWYNQRAKATNNAELRALLEHNRDEEKEHAAMALEWLRRSDPTLSRHLETFLFKEKPITEIETEMARGHDDSNGGLQLRSLLPWLLSFCLVCVHSSGDWAD